MLDARSAIDSHSPQAPGPDMRPGRSGRLDGVRNLAVHDVRQRGHAALVWNVRRLDAGGDVERHDDEVSRRAGARAREAVLARIGTQERHELLCVRRRDDGLVTST